MDEDEQFNQAFGEHTGIPEECREIIDLIRYNNIDLDMYDNVFTLDPDDAENFSNLAWELFGRYIANNTHLKRFGLDSCHLTDEKMTLLFRELTYSKSLNRLDLDGNEFGIDSVRSMTPLLQNCPNISTLYLCGNDNINSECFEVLISALSGKAVIELSFYGCNITDISALETYNLPHLEELNLGSNNIGRDGCITISNLLQKEGSTLKEVFVIDAGIDDEGAEILANSIKHNAKLERLSLLHNDGITEIGCKFFLKLLVDISSIKNTSKSNHTLTLCQVCRVGTQRIQSLINDACMDNRAIDAGRSKVIKYQLDSQKRKELCEWQGIEYSPGSLFVDIEPVLLPSILALIGGRHGRSELYTALVQTAPDLLSYIDRKAMLKDEMEHNTAKLAALTAEYEHKVALLTAKGNDIDNRLALIDIGDSKQQLAGGQGGNSMKVGDKKRKVQH